MKRRAFIAGVAAIGVAVAAGLYRFTDLFVNHYPPTPYDDLLGKLVDREYAARLGKAAHQTASADALAARLRKTVPDDLKTAIGADIAAGRLSEVDGWLVPQTLMLLSALASKV